MTPGEGEESGAQSMGLIRLKLCASERSSYDA